MTKLLLTVAAFLSTLPTTYGESYTYRTITGSDTSSTIFSIQPIQNGRKATAEYHNEYGVCYSEVVMNDSFSTCRWKYTCRQENSDFCGSIMNNSITLKGFHKNKKIDRVYPLESVAWRQMFPFDLKKFVLSDSVKTRFRGVSTLNLGNLLIGTLEAEKTGTEHLTINGRDMELLHVKVTLLGMFSMFWHGDYWFRKDTGMFVKSASFDFPGAPPVVTVLAN